MTTAPQARNAARPQHGGQSGQALVEFALTLPIFLLLTLGLFELGRAVWLYNTLSGMAREGARWGVVLSQFNEHPGERCIAGNASGTYDPADTYLGTPTVVGHLLERGPGLDAARVSVTIATSMPCTPEQGYFRDLPFTVTVEYPFVPVVGGFLGIPGTIDLRGQATMRVE